MSLFYESFDFDEFCDTASDSSIDVAYNLSEDCQVLAEQNERLIELVEEMASFKDEQGKSYYLGKLNKIKGGE